MVANLIPIKTIIFDLGGVYFTDGAGRFIRKIYTEFNIPEEKIIAALKGDIGLKYRTGKISEEEFWNSVKKFLGIDINNDKLADMWHSSYELQEGTLGIIKKLRDAGYEVIFLSNNIKERAEYLQKKYNFTEDFHDGVFSHVVQVNKPDLEIYRQILKKTKSMAEECVFIDDKVENLVPARELGMKGIHFRNARQLEKELLAYIPLKLSLRDSCIF